MKCKLICGLLSMALTRALLATDAVYENNGTVIAPPDVAPQVDATNFINTGYFNVTPLSLSLYTTLNTLNYTNTSAMVSGSGFDMETFPNSGGPRMAANYYNSGTIDCDIKLIVSATNISNPGNISMATDSLLKLTGKHVDLSRSVLAMEGLVSFLSSTYGVVSQDYGNGLSRFSWFPDVDLTTNYAYSSLFTNYMGQLLSLDLANSAAYCRVTVPDPSIPTNVQVRAVFLQNNNPAVSTRVFIDRAEEVGGIGFGGAHIEWSGTYIDPQTGVTSTNYFYLSCLLDRTTNAAIFNGIPDGYTFAQNNGFPLTTNVPLTSGLPANVFLAGNVTNSYAYLDADVITTTKGTNAVVNGSITNLPGRIQISAATNLDLALAQIYGENYLLLESTNHYSGNTGASISAPYADIRLGVTNGALTISNLWRPALPFWNGTFRAWNARWFDSANGTNYEYRILLVDSTLVPLAPGYVQDLQLHATNNLVISDSFNVYRNLSIDAQHLTLTTNGYGNGAISAAGELNLPSTTFSWANSVPRVRWLTNNGAIRAQGVTGISQAFGNSSPGGNYLAFINTGSIVVKGATVWANYFQNSGSFSNLSAPFTLNSTNSDLANGIITAGTDLAITTGRLNTSNTVLQAGGSLTLTVTNLLTDNGVTNGNIWTLGSGATVINVVNGLSLPIRPTVCDLLGTTITNTLPGPNKRSLNLWSGADRGMSVAGFSNNAALGRLILDAQGGNSQFVFNPRAGETNALYVDCLELRNFATNRDGSGNFYTAISNHPNFVIYYAQAIVNGVSYAEKLNHKNSDHLRWVSGYVGHFSSTNLVYGGTTNTVNAALAQSTTEDTDGDGIVNGNDPTPFFLASQLNFSLTVSNFPPLKSVLKWNTIPSVTHLPDPAITYATNRVFYCTNLFAPNWQVLTNFVSPVSPPSPPVTVSVTDPVNLAVPRYYRVQVDPQLP